jgi:hypothetical protein
MNAQFLAIARDPRLIPGVHQHCDEWCNYCPLTSRCLAFRCLAEFRRQHGRSHTDPPFTSVEAAVVFTRELAAIEGTPTEEMDALPADLPGGSDLETSDPLASVAWEYAVHVALVLTATGRAVASVKSRPSGPEPEDVVAWYHLRIYLTVLRALISREKSSGSAAQMEEATGSAKLALVSMERSRGALQLIRSAANDLEITGLIAMLDALERGLDERFPNARSFLRIGLDCPIA